MKLKRLSLVAVMLIGSSAFAIENTKVSGNAELYYGTQSSTENDTDMFNKDSSYTNFAARLDLTTDLTKGVSAGVGMQVVTTLGVEHNLVDSVWSNAHTASASTGATFHSALGGNLQVDSAMWFDEVWLAGTAFDTTLKIGRQSLDTPLAFTETWGVDKNTFEAVVLINQSLPNTTIVATYIGKSNGSADDMSSNRENNASNNLNDYGAAAAGYVSADGLFNTFGVQGTYAFGLVNNSFKPLTVQAWYYDMIDLAQAYWLQADLNLDGILVGAQYASTDLDDNANLGTLTSFAPIGANTEATTAYSAMIGYEAKDVVTVKLAYSSVDEDGTLGVANTATGSVATIGGVSKLYTEMRWNYGNVSAVGADTFAITAQTKVSDIDLFLGYYDTDIEAGSATVQAVRGFAARELQEVAFRASTSFGPLDTAAAIIYADNDEVGTASDAESIDLQLYLTYNF
ncbi:hypothetical protein [Candidatus Sulfurimonas baltica]|uniref:Alginate export domain-containing protein n=1 Tax=Candidatus Sulfurimonas baltica TaxID=2740404 RepID=A0A7S7LW26_9BACT|nr:hypothetical protein [Candidatus Sulfurimonas baltica]QOY52445.1 hypothetical protein HUE88_01740 [Candidatus Sulfurimonas baltica]